MQWLILICAVLFAAVAIKPLRPLFIGLLRCALAFAGIMAVNHVGNRFGVAFPLNILNASLIGFLGVPGAVSAMALGMII